MMTKDKINFSEETKMFHKAIDLFFGMNPEKRLWIILMLYFGKERVLHIIDNTSPREYADYNSYKDINWHVMTSLSYDDITNQSTKSKWDNEGITSRFVLADTPSNLDCSFDELVYSLDIDSYNMRKSENSEQNIFRRHQWESIYLMEIAEIFISLSDKWYNENASWAFNFIISKLQNQYGVHGGIFVQPKEITTIVGKLLNAVEGTVYNPYAGIGSYAMVVGKDCRYIGQDFSPTTTAIGKLNLLINKKDKAVLENSNVTEHWKGDNQKFDYIVSTPPFGFRLPESEYKNAELSFLAKSSHDAQIKSIGIYPASICYSSNSVNTKVISRLIDEDILESVILLPANVFTNTAIETTIIVVNKKKENRGYVRMIDASDCYFIEGRHNILDVERVLEKYHNNFSGNSIAEISIQDISSSGYKIYPKFYCSIEEIAFPEGYHIVELNEIIETCPCTRKFNDSVGRIAMISQLSNDGLDCERTVDYFDLSSNIANTAKVVEPVILFSMIREIKPTYCVASPDNPLFVHSNVSAYRIKANCQWVDPKYLCYELSRRAANVTTGVIPRVSRDVLLKTRIGFPSLDIQNQQLIVKEAIHQSMLAKARELGLQDVIESLKADYINEVRTRKHDMRPYLRELRSAEKLIRFYVAKRESMSDFEQKVTEQLDNYRNALSHLSNLVDIFSEEEQFGKAEIFNIDQYFSELRKSHNPELSGYELSYEKDFHALNELGLLNSQTKHKEFSVFNGMIEFKYEKSVENKMDSLFIHIAPIDFERMVKNIIVNAREHGFLNPEENLYELKIHLSVDTKKAMYQIDFINNGTPLPLGMNKLRYGIRGEKAGITGGTGNGGYIVKSIVEHYKGDYDVFMDNNNTVIRIYLPIIKQNDEQDV